MSTRRKVAQGREKLIFALKECCLLVLCATVVIAATRAHMGLLNIKHIQLKERFIITKELLN
jgi:hypothetical protein